MDLWTRTNPTRYTWGQLYSSSQVRKGTKLKLNKFKRISPEFDWLTEFICSSSFDPVLIVYCVELTQYEIMHSEGSSQLTAIPNVRTNFRPSVVPLVRRPNFSSKKTESYHLKMAKLVKNLAKSYFCIK